MEENNKRGAAVPDGLDNQGQDRPGSQHNTQPVETPLHLTTNSTLQTEEENRHDKSIDPRADDSLDVSRSDRHEIRAGRLTGRDETNSDENTNA